MAGRLRAREIDDDEGRRLARIVRRIASVTGCDPRQVADLFELRAAARLLDAQAGYASHLPDSRHLIACGFCADQRAWA